MKIGSILMIIGAVCGVIGFITFQWLTLVPLGAILFAIGLVMTLGTGAAKVTAKAVKTASGDKTGTGRL